MYVRMYVCMYVCMYVFCFSKFAQQAPSTHPVHPAWLVGNLCHRQEGGGWGLPEPCCYVWHKKLQQCYHAKREKDREEDCKDEENGEQEHCATYQANVLQ